MEEQGLKNDLEFSPLAIDWMANNTSCLVANHDVYQYYTMVPGSDGIHQVPVPIPQWNHLQQIPQSYVDFLAANGYPEIKKQSYDVSAQVHDVGLAYHFQSEEYLSPFISKYTGMEHQYGDQEKDLHGNHSHAFQDYSGSGFAASIHPSRARRKRSREKSYAADRLRRMRISQWLDALHDLLPHPIQGGKTALLDDVIDYVKHLQYQVKELCRSRFGGESASNSLIFVEGHGHYIVHEQGFNGPLEEMMGKLAEDDPSAATELLQSRGLVVKPMTLERGVNENVGVLDIQGKKDAFLMTSR